jgi:hypothetical protein
MTTVRWRIFLILLLLTAINYIDRAAVGGPAVDRAEFNLTPAMEADAQRVLLVLCIDADPWRHAGPFSPAASSARDRRLGRLPGLGAVSASLAGAAPSRIGWAWPNRRSCPPAPSSTVPGCTTSAAAARCWSMVALRWAAPWAPFSG